MSHRKFVHSFAVALALFFLANYIIWENYTEILLTRKYDGGDLSRISYIVGSRDRRKKEFDLPVKHREMKDVKAGEKIDVLTIGDSFSQGGGGGKNSFYQDYIASLNRFSVVNVYPYPTDDLVAFFSPLSTLKVLYSSGYLDILKPRYVVVESVERFCLMRFAKPFSLNQGVSLKDVVNYYQTKKIDADFLPPVSFINNGNFKFLYHNLLSKLPIDIGKKEVMVAKLDRPLFNVRNGDDLLIFHEDVRNVKYITPDAVKLLNEQFNQMSDLLDKKGIKLYFMPIVDKYDLYSDYIVSNHYPKSTFFEELRKLPKRYSFIDTKAILAESLKNGEKDIFYADDTHWSWKAAKKVFETVKFE